MNAVCVSWRVPSARCTDLYACTWWSPCSAAFWCGALTSSLRSSLHPSLCTWYNCYQRSSERCVLNNIHTNHQSLETKGSYFKELSHRVICYLHTLPVCPADTGTRTAPCCCPFPHTACHRDISYPHTPPTQQNNSRLREREGEITTAKQTGSGYTVTLNYVLILTTNIFPHLNVFLFLLFLSARTWPVFKSVIL